MDKRTLKAKNIKRIFLGGKMINARHDCNLNLKSRGLILFMYGGLYASRMSYRMYCTSITFERIRATQHDYTCNRQETMKVKSKTSSVHNFFAHLCGISRKSARISQKVGQIMTSKTVRIAEHLLVVCILRSLVRSVLYTVGSHQSGNRASGQTFNKSL